MCLNNGHLSDIFRTFIAQYPCWKLEEITGLFYVIPKKERKVVEVKKKIQEYLRKVKV